MLQSMIGSWRASRAVSPSQPIPPVPEIETIRTASAADLRAGFRHGEKRKADNEEQTDETPRKRPVTEDTSGRVVGVSGSDTRECSICADDQPSSNLATEALTNTCTHDLTACRTCIRTHIDTEIHDKSWDQVSCLLCNATLPFYAVREYASTAAFEIYDQKALSSFTAGDGDFVSCLNTACSSGQLHQGGADEPIVTCNTCQAKSCFIHQMPWHSGKTCAEYDAERAEEIRAQELASAELVKKSSTRCPKCGVAINEIIGCDHMTCKLCRQEFCYRCGVTYQDIRRIGNSAHQSTCAHYRAIEAPTAA